MPTMAYDAMLHDGARERPSEHQMISFSAKPYNQRSATLSTHQYFTPVQRRHHKNAHQSFGEAATVNSTTNKVQTL